MVLTARNFTLFSLLPYEIRIVIWKFALPRRRLLTVSGTEQRTRHQECAGAERREIALQPHFSLQYLNLLGTSYEARSVALLYYPPRLGIRFDNRPLNVDCVTDIFYLKDEKALSAFQAFNHASLRGLAIEIEMMNFKQSIHHLALSGPLWRVQALEFACQLENVKDIVVELPPMSRIRSIHKCKTVAEFRDKVLGQFALAWMKKWPNKKTMPTLYFLAWQDVQNLGN